MTRVHDTALYQYTLQKITKMKIVTTTVTTVTKQIDCPPTEGVKFAWLNGKCLESAAYSHVLNQLFVTFRASENTYRYFDVPASEFLNLQIAESAGKYYNSNIKGKYKGEYYC